MTITTKVVMDINFSEEDKEIIKKTYKLVDDYGNRIRKALDTLDGEYIEVDVGLLRDCYSLADSFDEVYDALSLLKDRIISFETEH